MHFPPILTTILMVLLSAVVVVVVFRRLRLSPVLGYLVAGALIGPYGIKQIKDTTDIAHMAEFGVVFLMFVIGLELSFERLVAMRRHVFGLGSLQVMITAGLLGVAAWYLGASVNAAIIIGAGLAFSSTALVLQVVQEHTIQSSQVGRLSLAVLLLQDLAVVPLLVLVPLLGKPDMPLAQALGSAALNAVLALAGTFLVGRTLLRPLFRIVASAGSSEIFEAFTLLVVLGVAAAFEYGSLSMAMGAFVAGLLVAETEYKHQVEADIMPFKSLLLGLFFMFVGMQIDFQIILEQRWSILAIVIGIMLVKATILRGLSWLFGVNRGKAWHTGLLLSQGGEFGFLLFSLAQQNNLLSPQLSATLMVAVTCSMALTPLAFSIGRWMSPRLNRGEIVSLPKPTQQETFDIRQHVIIIGFGRVGQTIGRLLTEEGIPYLAIEMDPVIVTKSRNAGMPVYYGDGAQIEVLIALGIERAASAVVTVNSFSAALRVIASLEAFAPELPVLARSSDLNELKQLEAAGADIAISEKYEAALQLGREVLRYTGVASGEIERILEVYRARDYELAAEGTLAYAMQHPINPQPKGPAFVNARSSIGVS